MIEKILFIFKIRHRKARKFATFPYDYLEYLMKEDACMDVMLYGKKQHKVDLRPIKFCRNTRERDGITYIFIETYYEDDASDARLWSERMPDIKRKHRSKRSKK